MKKIFCLAAVLAVVASPALAQDSGATEKASVYYRPNNSQSPEAVELTRLIQKELDDSRYVELVQTQGDDIWELDGPLKMTKDAAGKKYTVTYEIAPGRGTERAYSASCNVDQLARCAEAIVLRTERSSRESVHKLF